MEYIGRKCLSLFLSLTMILSVFGYMPASVSAAEGNWTGSGTTSDPYLIEDAADLEELSNTLTASQAYSGKYFKVTDDIEVSGWNPIGSSSSASFKGIFDGDGHTITINGIDPDYGQTVSTYYAGLFGYLKGSVYNVTVDGQIFSDKGYAYIGGIAGYYAADYSAVHIVNCVNLAEISLSGNYSYAGGIVGYVNSNYDYLYNCYNGGSVSASGNGSKSGGTAAYVNNGKFFYCINDGSVEGTKGANYGTQTECYDLTAGGDFPEFTQEMIDGWNASVSGWTENTEFWMLQDGKPVPKPRCSHQHAAGDTGTVVAPTCTEDGYVEYTCVNCGNSYREAGEEALGHSLSKTQKDATCTEDGEIVTKCLREGCDYQNTEVIPAKGHHHADGDKGEDKGSYIEYTCIDCSQKYQVAKDERLQAVTVGEGIEVSFSEETSYPWKYIQEKDRLESSNQAEGKSVSRLVVTITSAADSILSFNYGVSSEPKYDKLTVKLDDEIIADGISGITENSCHEKELEAGSHTLSLSYEKDVSTDLNEDCGYISDIVISKLCQHVNRTEQSYTEATCTEPAFTVYLCSDCGKSFSVIDEDNAALGHVYGENGFCMRDGCNARTFESFFYGMDLEYENDSTYPWTVNEDYDAIISGNAKAENTYQFSQLKLTANRAGTLSFDFEPEITSGDTYSSLIVTKNQENGKTVKSAEKISADLNAGDTYTLKYLSGYIKPFSYAKVKNITFTANECRHENTTSAASPKDGAQHTLTVTCSDCGASVSTSDEPHDMNYTHISGMSKHRAYCPTCGYDTEESCDSTGTDGTCSKCGYNDAEGSETNPYLISTADDLKKLAAAVNSGENQAGKYYKLTEDLELPGNFEPIGRYMGNPVYADYAFAGNFDGDGHTVTVNITDRTGSNARVGLFGSVKGTDQSQPAVIKNLTVRGTVLSQKGGQCVAGLAGVAENARIENCGNMASVTNMQSNVCAGGLIGRVSGNVTISGCFNTGTIVADGTAGGLVGSLEKGNNRLEHSYNVGSLTNTNDQGGAVGGLIGNAGNLSIDIIDCYAGNTEQYVGLGTGGLIGTPSQSMTITSCFWQENQRGPENWYGSPYDYGITADAVKFDDYTVLLDEEEQNHLDTAYYMANTGASKYPLLRWQKDDGSGNQSHTHSFTETVTAPQCNAEGFTTYTCVCGYSYRDNFTDKTPHEFENWMPSEVEDDIYTHTRVCKNCGESETANCELTWSITEQAKPGKPGKKQGVCADCGRTVEESYMVSYANGTGTAEDPYLITSEAELRSLAAEVNEGNEYTNTYFKMTEDIQVSSETPWPSIGGKEHAFSGNFNGDNHRITFSFDNPEKDFTALFGRLENAVVERVITAGSISGGSFTAGIAGYAKNSEIRYCGNEAAVTGGQNHSYSQNQGPDEAYAAGIAAYTSGAKIAFCYNRGNVTNQAVAAEDSRYAGGITAEATSGTTIQYCYNNANIASSDQSDNYCYTAGIVGMMWTGSLTYSYNAGNVENGGTYTGAVLGSGKSNALTGGHSYYVKGTAAKGAGGNTDADDDEAYGLTPVEASELQSSESAAGIVLSSAFTDDYALEQSVNDGFLILQWEKDAQFEYQPIYEISTKEDLELFRNTVRTGYDYSGETVKLMNDIALNEDEPEELWQGIGDIADNHIFAGTFDGQNHEITGLFLYGMTGNIGLFNAISQTAKVENLTVRGEATGYSSSIGSIAGTNYGAIENCVSYINITTDSERTLNDYIGGITAQNAGTVRACSNYGTITLYSGAMDGPAGGIAGNNEGRIISCRNYAEITGSDKTGGIAGKCEILQSSGSGIEIVDCGNYASISGCDYVGGIIGAGFSLPINIAGCTNKSDVTAQGDYAGGIAGYMSSGDSEGGAVSGTAAVTDSYNLGEIVSLCVPAPDTDTGSMTPKGYYIGGIVGRAMLGELKIVNCYNSGMIRGAEDGTEEIGALAGYTTANVENCYYRDIMTSVYGKAVSHIRLRSNEMVQLLGDSYQKNTGYPLLDWEEPEISEEEQITISFRTADGDASITWTEAKNSSVQLPANPYGGDVWKCDSKEYKPGDYYMTAESDIVFVSGTASGQSGSGGGGGGSSSGVQQDSVKDRVTVDAGSEGTVAVSPEKVTTGDTITVEVKPADGYVVDTVTAADGSGKAVDVKDKGNGAYTFTLPEGKVTVHVTYRKTDAAQTGKFTDVASGAWYYEAVYYAADHGYFQGISDTLFRPDGSMTRAMFATVIGRMAGVNESKYTGSAFSDVPEGEWYSAYVKWASENGIVSGVGEGRFSPDSEITREQMAAMLYRYAKFTGADTSSISDTVFNGFADKDTVSAYAKEAMIWATSEGIISGTGSGLSPKNNATRAQVAQILMNYAEKTAK